jgi:hypothetical protein
MLRFFSRKLKLVSLHDRVKLGKNGILCGIVNCDKTDVLELCFGPFGLLLLDEITDCF